MTQGHLGSRRIRSPSRAFNSLVIRAALVLGVGACQSEGPAPPRISPPPVTTAPPPAPQGAQGTSGGRGGAADSTGGPANATGAGTGGQPPTVPAGADSRRAPRPWARWPMPNAPAAGLPNPSAYDVGGKGVVRDKVTGLAWQRTVSPKPQSWLQAIAYCQELRLGGSDDWDLPSRIELSSIADRTRSRPAIDPRAFPKTPAEKFWTASVRDVNPDGAAWFIDFEFGHVATEPTNQLFHVRCVRKPGRPSGGGAPPSSPPFDARGEVVRDGGTGLTWQRAIAAQTFDFDKAQAYCAELKLAPPGTWRVPAIGELLTILDESTHNPMVDARAFPQTPSRLFWTSSMFDDKPPAKHATPTAWWVDFEYGNVLAGSVKESRNVRCVR